ncbi:hypothetical protein [Staphylococcus ratti]|uniref:Uncharacterized protein n=1 Tax=Staphylococcus ratti TaxID=2892440 RepID=A0ABY3PB55_9STAP|nr:hypothetical protein [Staphylococcus ratti]UEX89531.1 hypothetical protein LN051_08105 [Staphylococcus ratti]
MKINDNYHIIEQDKYIYVLNVFEMCEQYLKIEIEDYNTIQKLKRLDKPNENDEYLEMYNYLKRENIIINEESRDYNKVIIKSYEQNLYIINCGFPLLNISVENKKIHYIFFLDQWLHVELDTNCQCFNQRLLATLPYLEPNNINILHEGSRKFTDEVLELTSQKIFCLPNCKEGQLNEKIKFCE